MRRVVLCSFLVSMTAGSSLAQESKAPDVDPIEARQAIMSNNGAAAKLGGQMVKGETPFDPAAAGVALRTMQSGSLGFGYYFPEGSDTGGDTEAAPAIWEKPEEFRSALAKFQNDAAAAIEAKPEDLEAFKQAFSAVTANCKSCHDEFRLEKN
ncbi:cytochrome c [Aurantimonas sp. HBX-1]|uniref:c-type cytochrome n=1 Tax=Aurantimonas sp. HBX-1 TaxID=2906072 RepID=UPI001F2AAA41|nr:cytochrome c [Aurantimonas sp. HBX-1]UIJ73381.1 cytochrome c [Aurantimonas sp. HBX-1]